MKSFIVAVCIVACAYAGGVVEQGAQVLRSEYNLYPEGKFEYVYETDNGISGQANGQVKAVGKDESALEVTGSNSYKSPEGEVFSVSYIANENGYQPQGAHLPAIPEYIARALEYVAAHPYSEKN